MYLLDTNICIYIIKNTYPHLSERVFSLTPSELSVSAVTVFELQYGAAKSRWDEQTRQKLAMFLAPFTILPFTTEDAAAAGMIRAALEKNGAPIGPYDIQIAAQGLVRDMTVITHNLAEFSRVPGLKLAVWTSHQ